LEALTENNSETEKIGFDKEFSLRTLERLVNQGDKLQKEYDDLRTKLHPGSFESMEMIGIRQQRERIEAKTTETRDWHGIHVLEELEVESRRIRLLTMVLIVLTAVLSIFTGFLVSGIRVP